MKPYILLTGYCDKEYFITEAPNVYIAIYNYYVFCHNEDTIFYKMCCNETIFTIAELINYCNIRCSVDQEIQEIYLLGEKVYG